jgi:hypothetical protein
LFAQFRLIKASFLSPKEASTNRQGLAKHLNSHKYRKEHHRSKS